LTSAATERPRPLGPALATVVLAAGLWYFTFALEWGVFWYKISFSALLLTAISWRLRPQPGWYRFDLRSIVLGAASAVLLWLIFWLGKTVSRLLFSFADPEVGGIYELGEGTPMWLIALLLFFVTSPCEELYWRGYLQRSLMDRLGPVRGWLAGAFLYAVVHLWSLNVMLTGAALVAGLFWGLLFLLGRDLRPCIVSHAIWSTVIFTALPVP
jgi:hypothetical protein